MDFQGLSLHSQQTCSDGINEIMPLTDAKQGIQLMQLIWFRTTEITDRTP